MAWHRRLAILICMSAVQRSAGQHYHYQCERSAVQCCNALALIVPLGFSCAYNSRSALWLSSGSVSRRGGFTYLPTVVLLLVSVAEPLVYRLVWLQLIGTRWLELVAVWSATGCALRCTSSLVCCTLTNT
jgi:hypothetical protein